MNRTQIALLVLVFSLFEANAALLFENSFEYTEGPIVSVSAGSTIGVWATHSGSTGQVDVINGRAFLSEDETEDVSCAITSANFPDPVSSGKIFASFTLNVDSLPSGVGGYFWHFRDNSTMNYRARVYVSTVGAATNCYRAGVGVATGPPAMIGTDLLPGVDYRLVVCYDIDRGSATLWINPNAETSVASRVTSTDPATPISPRFVCLRQSLSSKNGMGVLWLDNIRVGTAFEDAATVGGPPSISSIPDQSLSANTNTGPLEFAIDDYETAAEELIVTCASSNPTLVPEDPASILVEGFGAARSVIIKPARDQQGVTTVSLVVTDLDGLAATTSFMVTVGAPGISAVPDQVVRTNTPTDPIPFTVWDAETPEALEVTVTTTNPSLVKEAVVDGSGTNRFVKLIPHPGACGVCGVSLTVSDGSLSASTRFNLSVAPDWGTLLIEDFDFADGPAVSVSGSKWLLHSGKPEDALVDSGRLLLTSINTGDIHAAFTNSTTALVSSGVILYSRMDVLFHALPSGDGGYFAHLKDGGTVNLRCRIYATTEGAEAGKFRVGIANASGSPVVLPRDLVLGIHYTLVSRYNVGLAASTLWIDPLREGSEGVSATDTARPITITQFAFRQDGPSGGIGSLLVDNLKVATTFAGILGPAHPGLASLAIQREGKHLIICWPDPALALQASEQPAGPFVNVSGASSPFTNRFSTPTGFFRLAR